MMLAKRFPIHLNHLLSYGHPGERGGLSGEEDWIPRRPRAADVEVFILICILNPKKSGKEDTTTRPRHYFERELKKVGVTVVNLENAI